MIDTKIQPMNPFLRRTSPTFVSMVILLVLLFAHFAAQAGEKKVKVTVLELKSMSAIQGATVEAVFARAASADQTKRKAVTDASGSCSFMVPLGEEWGWSFGARKEGFFQVFSKNPEDPKISMKNFISQIDESIVLYLTTDTEHLKAYYNSITPHMQIDTLIAQLKADRYSPSSKMMLPDLAWSDIPKLMEIADNATKITKFAQHPASNVIQENCFLGIYAMWLIESIRISYGKTLLDPYKRFPSLRPVLIEKSQGGEILSLFENNGDQMMLAYNAYTAWWNRVKEMPPAEACRIDPLEGCAVHW